MLAMLVAADLVFFVVHWANFTVMQHWLYTLNHERSYVSIYTFLKEFWAALLLIAYAWRRHWSLWMLAALVAYILLDDTAEIHETMAVKFLGPWLSAAFAPDMDPNQAAGYGELIYIAVVFALVSLPGLAMYKQTPDQDWQVIVNVGWIIAGLLVFAVGVDFFHTFFRTREMAFIEEGGELLTISVLAAYAFGLLYGKPRAVTSSP